MPDLCIFILLQVRAESVLYSCLGSDSSSGVSLLHIWEAQPDLHSAAPQGGKEPAEINGGESFKNLGAEAFLQLKVFSYQPQFQP